MLLDCHTPLSQLGAALREERGQGLQLETFAGARHSLAAERFVAGEESLRLVSLALEQGLQLVGLPPQSGGLLLMAVDALPHVAEIIGPPGGVGRPRQVG
jgi:hypothetical protein